MAKNHNTGGQPHSDALHSQAISIIEVRPEDRRQSVLTAIMLQEKLGRQQTLLLLPAENKAFYRKVDFEGLRQLQRELHTQLVIIAPPDSKVAAYARQQRLPVFASLEQYAVSQRSAPSPSKEPSSDERSASALEPASSSGMETGAGVPPGPPAAPVRASAAEKENTTALVPSTSPAEPPGALLSPRPVVSSGFLPPLIRLNRVSTGLFASKRAWLLLGIVIGLLLLASLTLIPLTQLFGGASAAASVIILPETRDLKQIYTLSAQPGLPANAERHQISARFLASAELHQSRQVPASGHGVTPARRAEGILTFYNALPVSQSIPKGTILSGQSGIQVVTDEAALLPAAMPPLESSTSVPAHALQPGSQGNLPAFAFRAFPCCANGITVQNPLAFSGGADPQPYTYVQQSDIDQASAALQADLIAEAQRSLQAQAAANERFVGTAQCPALTSANQQAGDRAASVTVTVTVVCSGEVYDQVGARVLAASLLANEATLSTGPSYSLVGQIITGVVSVAFNPRQPGLLTVRVQAEGIWAYHLNDQERLRLANLIKGKTRDQALTLLKQQTGIRSASIVLSGPGSRLPENAAAITIREAAVVGLKGSPLPTALAGSPLAHPPATPQVVQPIGSGTPSMEPSPLPTVTPSSEAPSAP
ncbi:baseplate J/gp47 family protein [Thermogemmatispora sp.]|uniref:baseplate J/gp47 family protein n=1 Tax=Thermogemmatispora sp. TaxID=1968838 RepID=UPI002ACBEC77|nr:baseplate J/gp47 family protein [Thermogemmatispora sp.]